MVDKELNQEINSVKKIDLVDEVIPDTQEDNEQSLEELKKFLDEKEKELNNRILQTEFKDKIKLEFSNMNCSLDDEMQEQIKSFIDFTNNETFNNSYERIIDFFKACRNVKSVIIHGYNGPDTGSSNKNNIIETAFKPPKVY